VGDHNKRQKNCHKIDLVIVEQSIRDIEHQKIIEKDQYQIQKIYIANVRQKSLKLTKDEGDADLVRICGKIAARIGPFRGGGVKDERGIVAVLYLPGSCVNGIRVSPQIRRHTKNQIESEAQIQGCADDKEQQGAAFREKPMGISESEETESDNACQDCQEDEVEQDIIGLK
jgi:hypothetical protein